MEGLTRRLQDLIAATNNYLLKQSFSPSMVENSIRPVAVGRKNDLFAGSHEAAQRSAILTH